MREKIFKYCFLFFLGGLLYYFLEIFTRGFSHFSMMLCGGACFVLCGLLNEKKDYEISIISQMVLSSLIITALELVTGLIVNKWLKLNVWDYSAMPYNFMGQICLQYSIIWMFLSLIIIFLDDFIRNRLFGEERAVYKIF